MNTNVTKKGRARRVGRIAGIMVCAVEGLELLQEGNETYEQTLARVVGTKKRRRPRGGQHRDEGRPHAYGNKACPCDPRQWVEVKLNGLWRGPVPAGIAPWGRAYTLTHWRLPVRLPKEVVA
jgi:hypothetical protein